MTDAVAVFRGVPTAPRSRCGEFLSFSMPGSDPFHVIVNAARVGRERGVEPRYMLICASVVRVIADHPTTPYHLQRQQKPPPPMFSTDAQWAKFLGELFGCESVLVHDGADVRIIDGESGSVLLVDCVTA